MTHVTCRLTAKNRDQLWNPTLGSRVRGGESVSERVLKIGLESHKLWPKIKGLFYFYYWNTMYVTTQPPVENDALGGDVKAGVTHSTC